MGRRGTWLVIGAVAAIALVAAFDSLRGGGETPAAGPGTTSELTTTEAVPADAETATQPAGFDGVLYYTDESCELRAVRLPELEPAEAPNWDECGFVLSPDGKRASGADSGWDPHSDPQRGRLFETEDGTIQVATNGGPEGEPFRGSAPAWRPDGTLTYFADGAVREWPGGNVLIPGTALLQGVMSHINAAGARAPFRAVDVQQLVWLDSERAVVAIHAPVRRGADIDLAAVFDGRRRVATVDELAPITSLWGGPQGRYWALDSDGLQLFDRDGGALPLPPLTDARAVAWSPDESWLAVATRASVFILRPGEPQARIQRLPLVANDLAWRSTVGPPEIADADEARDWLGGVRASGRLFVTEPGCRLRALRLPDLEWEEEPAGDPAPCRFALDVTDQALAEAISVAPGGQLRATCRDGRLVVFGSQGTTADVPDACAPAWMPDGTLTFIRAGELWRGTVEPRLLISREDLRSMFGREAALEEVAWFDDERLWAVVRVGTSDAIAAMTESRLVYSPTFTAPRIEGLEVSPTGMVAARTDRGVVFFDNGGRRALSFPGATAVAWAPDNLVAAVATPRQILLVAPVSREVVPLPLAVEDLEWVVP
jgi:hypothetical protein